MNEARRRSGRGLYAEALLARFPNLPVEEEGRLHDPRLRENWVTRVFAYHRLRSLWKRHWTFGDLVRFHTAHKFLLLAHSPKGYRDLGRLVAEAKTLGKRELPGTYETQFMSALSKTATQAKNTYSGIFRVLGRYDRPWGPERPIFGKVRYMSSESAARKLKLGAYLAKGASGNA